MARSMTAFGRAGEVVNGKEILVEIRPVNNRYLDTSVKISRAYGSLEERVKSYLQSKGISRGKVDVLISVNVLENKTAGVALDSAYAASYIAALRQLRDEFSLPDDISVMKVAENQDIFAFTHGEEDDEEAWSDICSVFDKAIAMFLERRKNEGENLKKDLLEKKKDITDYECEKNQCIVTCSSHDGSVCSTGTDSTGRRSGSNRNNRGRRKSPEIYFPFYR